jgi:hypothetical protein
MTEPYAHKNNFVADRVIDSADSGSLLEARVNIELEIELLGRHSSQSSKVPPGRKTADVPPS